MFCCNIAGIRYNHKLVQMFRRLTCSNPVLWVLVVVWPLVYILFMNCTFKQEHLGEKRMRRLISNSFLIPEQRCSSRTCLALLSTKTGNTWEQLAFCLCVVLHPGMPLRFNTRHRIQIIFNRKSVFAYCLLYRFDFQTVYQISAMLFSCWLSITDVEALLNALMALKGSNIIAHFVWNSQKKQGLKLSFSYWITPTNWVLLFASHLWSLEQCHL